MAKMVSAKTQKWAEEKKETLVNDVKNKFSQIFNHLECFKILWAFGGH